MSDLSAIKLNGTTYTLSDDYARDSMAKIEYGTLATKAYAVGDFLINNNHLYKVTSAIAIGVKFVVGTNIELVKLSDEVKLKAPLESPTFTGTPKVPTASTGTKTTQIASTAYVQNEIDIVNNNVQSTIDYVQNELGGVLTSLRGDLNSLDSEVDTISDDVDSLDSAVDILTRQGTTLRNDGIVVCNAVDGGDNVFFMIDDTLTEAHKAADAKATGDAISSLNEDITNISTATASDVGKALKVKTVTSGKVTEWEFGEAGGADPEVIEQEVQNWLDNHPEATTTVQDGSITQAKLATSLQSYFNSFSVGEIETSDAKNFYLTLENGGMYGSTGKNYGSNTRARTDFIPVTPGQQVIVCSTFPVGSNSSPYMLEFADNTVTTDTTNVRLLAYNVTSQRFIKTVSASTNYIRIMTYASAADSSGKLWIELPAHQYIESKPFKKTYATMSDMISDMSLESGNVVCTSGFNTDDDFGGGVYYILTSGVIDNCVVFALANGLYAHRVFDKPYVYLESLNYPTISIKKINALLILNGLRELRCNNITTSESIKLDYYNFAFNDLKYTGSDFAIIVDGISNHNIKGNVIYAPNGSCIKMVSDRGLCDGNYIQVNKLEAKAIGLGIFPTNGSGISHNFYNIRNINSELYGIRSYIPASTGKYSWEGEDLFSVSQIQAKNNDGTGVGVSLKIDPVNSITTDGTITGLTFLNLAVEGSDTGIDMNCGIINPNNIDACIKSIYINNLRGRETYTSSKWLTGYGYIRDVYIKPTAPTRLFQWDLNTTVGTEPCIIDGVICLIEQTTPIANGLMFRMGKKYVTEKLTGIFNITQDTDFSELNVYRLPGDTPEYLKNMFFCDTFNIDSSLIGQTVNINLAHYLDKSADGIKFILPAAAQGGAVTVKVKYYYPQKVITLTNTSSDTKVYQINVLHGVGWNSNVRFIVKDLGAPDEDITVPYNYTEPTS